LNDCFLELCKNAGGRLVAEQVLNAWLGGGILHQWPGTLRLGGRKRSFGFREGGMGGLRDSFQKFWLQPGIEGL
jgi:hypothetical protein